MAEATSPWLWIATLALVVILVSAKISAQKKRKVKPFASSGASGFISSVGDSVGLIIFITVLSAVVLIVLLIVVSIADAITGGKVQNTIDTAVATVRGEDLPVRPDAACDMQRNIEAINRRLSDKWLPINVCHDDKPVKFFIPSGSQPEIAYRDAGDIVLNSRSIFDFVRVEPTWGTPGGMPNLYIIYIPHEPNGFSETKINSVKLAIRSY